MPRAVIDPARVPKTIREIRNNLHRRGLKLVGEEAEHEPPALIDEAFVPGPIRNVSVSRGLLRRRDLVDPPEEGFKDVENRRDGGGAIARVGNLMATDGLGKRDDETEEVTAGRRLLEPSNVIGVVDPLGGGLELVRS